MRTMTKLLGLWVMGRTATATTPLFIRLASSMAVIAFLVIFIMMLAMTVMVAGLWSLYSHLLTMGIAPVIAKLMLLLIVATFMLAAAIAIQHYIVKIRRNVRAIVYAQAPISGRVAHIADAFVRGLSSGKRAA